jgi:predicted nucleic acid-binding protein
LRGSAKYLLDAPALYPLVLKLGERILSYSNLFAILDLTVYEVGNAIWKEYRKGRIKDPVLISRMFEEVIGDMKRLSMDVDVSGVQEVAVKESLTFYDAAYVYVARKHGLKLVTEDKMLLKLPESTNVDSLLREIGFE